MGLPNNFGVVDEVKIGMRPGRSERWRRCVQIMIAAGVVILVLRGGEFRARVYSCEWNTVVE